MIRLLMALPKYEPADKDGTYGRHPVAYVYKEVLFSDETELPTDVIIVNSWPVRAGEE